jgi:ribosomal protein L12E/L44/L45/RPP1/RPP2
VRNAIAYAKKLEWGLHEADDWMQRKTRGEMKAALDDAKYVAEKNGIALPGEYYDLLKKVDGAPDDTDVGGVDTVLADTQRIEGLVRNKNLHDKDIRELYAKADKMGDNSSEAAKLRALADKYNNSTVEKKAAGEQEKSEAGREASKINGVKNKDMRRQMFDNGSDALRKYYKYDEKSGLVVKVGK